MVSRENKYTEKIIQEEQGEKPKIEKQKVGTETIDGHSSDKFLIKITYKNGNSEEVYIWEAKDLDRFVIKAEMENKDSKVVVEMKNIQLSSPQKTLFEVPQGYIKASNMMEIFMD